VSKVWIVVPAFNEQYAEGAAACETSLSLKPDCRLTRNNLAFAQSKLRK